MLISDDQLAKILLENQLVTQEKLKKANEVAKRKNLSFYNAIIDQDLITDEQFGRLIADFLKFPFVNLSKHSIDPEVLNIVPEVVAKKQKIISFAQDKDGLKLAMNDPANREVVSFLQKKTGENILIHFATSKDINEALHLYKKNLQISFEDLLKEKVDEAGKTAQKEAPISKILDLLIEYAYQNKASDIHIEPEEEKSLVRYRIDGVLHDVLNFPRTLHDQIITRIKVLSRLRTDEHLSAQDGKMQFKLEEENLDIRVSIVPIVNGEKAVLRLLSSRSRQFALNGLGVSEKDLAKITDAFTKPYGMILATGPTGSGKTTTIYAILKILNTRDKNIATIEDPVEYDIEGINQIQANPKTNLTFADGLRSILRQDPDIIFVGEIRDQETAGIAVNSAMTGHLVLSTLHTNNASTALLRLIDMKIEPFLVASTINVIIAQRLVRQICEKCKTSYELKITGSKLETTSKEKRLQSSPEEIPISSLGPHLTKLFANKKSIRIYRGKGCTLCHQTGFLGRIAIFEVLTITEEIRKLIMAKADSDSIEKKAIEEGMKTLLDDGLDKIERGITTIEEVIRVTKE